MNHDFDRRELIRRALEQQPAAYAPYSGYQVAAAVLMDSGKIYTGVNVENASYPAGTCAEIGKFHEKIERGDHKYIVGICTDNRQMYLTHSEAKNQGGASALGEQQYSYQNLYVTGLIKQGGVLVSNIDDAIAFIKAREKEFNNEELNSEWR